MFICRGGIVNVVALFRGRSAMGVSRVVGRNLVLWDEGLV